MTLPAPNLDLRNPPKRASGTYEQYMAAARIADQQGNEDDARELLKRAQVAKLGQEVMSLKDQPEGSKAWSDFAPLTGMNGPERFAAGAGLAVRNLGRGAAETVGIELDPRTPEQLRKEEFLQKSPAGIAGNVVGNMAMMAPASFVPGANGVIGAGVIGAGLGLLQPTGEMGLGDERLKNTAIGGGFGLAGGALSKALSRVLSPQTSQEVQNLRNSGVDLTPGQVLGGGFKTAEEKAVSLPFVGNSVRAGQMAARESFNTATINKVLQPVGKKVTGAGYDAVAEAHRLASSYYDDALRGLKVVQLDKQFGDDVAKIYQMAEKLPGDRAKQLSAILKQDVLGKITPSNRMSARTFKEIESTLKGEAAAYLKDPNIDTRKYGKALFEIAKSLRRVVERADPARGKMLRNADSVWKGLIRIERAAGAQGATDGVFTPAQLRNAAKALDNSLRKTSFAHGKAPMQSWATDAQKVIAETIPNSGTWDRAIAGAGGVSLIMNPQLVAPYLAAAIAGKGAASAAYSPTGMKVLAKVLADRPEMLRQAGGALGKIVGPSGGFAALLASQLPTVLNQ